MTCKSQIKSIAKPQNANSPRLEQALRAVELAFDTFSAHPNNDRLDTVIQARAALSHTQLLLRLGFPRYIRHKDRNFTATCHLRHFRGMSNVRLHVRVSIEGGLR